ncbi:MAG: Transcriptional activator protein CzcR [Chloroflexi bacterium]|nr:Transcriptional activator protein CzcR [Chloroflexota bacterium]
MHAPSHAALIIEDDKKQANIFRESLSLANFEVEVITNGSTAMQHLQTASPDLVLLDLHLPFISGEKLLRQIRNTARLEKTKVILTTADPQMANMLQDECDLVMIKPISFLQLQELAPRLFEK